MGHQITQRDRVYLAITRETFEGKGWHGLGIPTERFDKESLAGILFPHELKPAGVMTRKGFTKTGQYYAIAGDDSLPVGNAVGAQYWTPQNVQLFDIFCQALEGSDYQLVSALTVENRNQFALDAKLKENLRAGKRDVASFVGLYRAFGGQSNIVCGGHTSVIQCANTTALFVREMSKQSADDGKVAFTNVKSLENKLDEIRIAIEKAHGVNAEFARAMEAAASEGLRKAQANTLFAGFLTDGKPLVREASERKSNVKTLNRVQRLGQLFERGAGNEGSTVADFFNSVTDFYTHESAGAAENEERIAKQWHSSEFGSAREVKAKLASSLFRGGGVDMTYVAKLREKGLASVAASDAKAISLSALEFN